MRVVCAWCESEGVTNVLTDGPDTGDVSHGICPRHAAEFVKVAA